MSDTEVRSVQERAVLLFDVMGTLASDPFPEAARVVLATSPEDLAEALDFTTLLQWERGEIDEATCMERLFLDRRAVDSQALKTEMKRSCRWILGMEEILTDLLNQRTVMHMLSDYSVWYQLIEEALGLSRYLPWTFVSCVTGVCKPDAAAFLGPPRVLRVPVSQCILIDDKQSNCAAASALGLQSIRFSNATELRRELTARRIL